MRRDTDNKFVLLSIDNTFVTSFYFTFCLLCFVFVFVSFLVVAILNVFENREIL